MAASAGCDGEEHGMLMVCVHLHECVIIPLIIRWQCGRASADYDKRHHAHHDACGWLLCHRSAVVDQLDEGECWLCQIAILPHLGCR
jgi:hypothetical protein